MLLRPCLYPIRRATRRQYTAEEKVRVVIAGLRGEDSIAELCRKEGINQNLYYRWWKDFLEAGKKRLAGDTAQEATNPLLFRSLSCPKGSDDIHNIDETVERQATIRVTGDCRFGYCQADHSRTRESRDRRTS
jgi:transposase-like protein